MQIAKFQKTRFQVAFAASLVFVAAWQYRDSQSALMIIEEKLSEQWITIGKLQAELVKQDPSIKSTWEQIGLESERMMLNETVAFKAHLLSQVEAAMDADVLNESDVRALVNIQVGRKMAEAKNKTFPETASHLKKIAEEIKNLTENLLTSMKINPELQGFYVYFKPEVEYFKSLDQEDQILADHVRQNLWVTPSPQHVPYMLAEPNKTDRTEGQLAAYIDVFSNTTSRFFIECGGLDGEGFSNTLDLESRHNWTGVLIEASPNEFGRLTKKNRKSALVPTCLSLEKRPTFVTFGQHGVLGKIMNTTKVPTAGHEVQVFCMPFYPIYRAIGQAQVDLFVLDIEGHEMEVLLTIPWNKVNILTLMVEFIHGKYSKDQMHDFMAKQNYRLYNGTKRTFWPGQNHFFIKRGSKYDKIHP